MTWIPLTQVLEVIDAAKHGKWCWSGNSPCKYVEIRIDMRDRHCLLKDRDGKPISIEELRYQHPGTEQLAGAWAEREESRK